MNEYLVRFRERGKKVEMFIRAISKADFLCQITALAWQYGYIEGYEDGKLVVWAAIGANQVWVHEVR